MSRSKPQPRCRMVAWTVPQGANYETNPKRRIAALLTISPKSNRPPSNDPGTGAQTLKAPLPGKITHVAVQAGDTVAAGQSLVVIEAMKMENVLRAERDGKVARLRAKPGDSLAVDQVILEFE